MGFLGSWVGKISWRRKWQSTPAVLPGKSHGRRSLRGYSPWDSKESDTTEGLHFHFQTYIARQDSLSMEFPKQEYWSGLLFPPPGDLPNPVIKPSSLTSPTLAGRFFTTRRRKWQPTLVFLPGESQGRRSLVGCSSWGRKESDTTEGLHFLL